MAWAGGNSQELEDFVARLRSSVEEALANGDKLPWRKPWINNVLNFDTGEGYSPLNTMWLSIAARANGWKSPFWAGHSQIQKHKIDPKKYAGATKGQHGTIILAPVPRIIENDEGEKIKIIRGFREVRVFNFEQLINVQIPEKLIRKVDEKVYPEWNEVQNAWLTRPSIRIGGNRASYSPTFDEIHMPEAWQFDSVQEKEATLAHEYIHSTGHEKRLKRSGIIKPTFFGTDEYAEEELIAEVGAAMLMAACGVEQDPAVDENHTAYLLNWIRRTKAKDLYNAFTYAGKATEYILNGGVVKKFDSVIVTENEDAEISEV